MQNSSAEDDRNVIPRWRSPLVTDRWELAAARDVGVKPITTELFADQIVLWRKEKTLSSYVDIYETGVITGDRRLQIEGARQIMKNRALVPEPLIDDIRRNFARPGDVGVRRELIAKRESSGDYLRFTIRQLKRRINDHPRDVLSLVEVARLYVLSGQIAVAERYIRRAVSLAPNDRFVLRSATQYYKLADGLTDILSVLRQSDAAAYDPLIQSTEIAASDLAGRGSKFAAQALRQLKGLRNVGVSRSELALAVATVEQASGLSQRRVFQLVRAGIECSTENAQAQAVWLGDQTGRPLGALLPNLKLLDDAFEAKALALLEFERYEEAVVQARFWLEDQPFEPDAVVTLCNCHAVYLGSASLAIPIADRAMVLHTDNWSVQNSVLLVYVRAQELAKARVALTNLERLAGDDVISAFAAAGAGLLAFAEGNVPVARQHYQSAIELARKASRPHLVFSAIIFWLHCEAEIGALDLPAFTKIVKLVDDALKKIPAGDRDYSTKLWRSIRTQCVLRIGARGLGIETGALDNMNHITEVLPKHLELI